MSRPGWAGASIVALALLLACGGGPLDGDAAGPAARVPPADAPNVLLVVIDALRWDRLGANGYPLPTTPNIDRLAAEGVSLDGFAHSTWTKPSIATLFTSVYPTQHGLAQVGTGRPDAFRTEVLAAAWTTLAERFAAAGYATGGFVNQIHLNPRFGFDQGFEHYHWVRRRSAFQLNGALAEWLGGLDGGRPFFAYLHYLDVHWPYNRALEGQRRLFGSVWLPSRPPGRAIRVDGWAERKMSRRLLRALAARYDREVAFADAGVGQVVDELRRLGLWDETLIVVTSDHGEAFWEHGRLLHGFEPFEELMRIPLVVRLPPGMEGGLAPGIAARAPEVGLIDLAPTLAAWAGLLPAPVDEGADLSGVLAGREGVPRRAIFADTAGLRAVRAMGRKVMLHADGRVDHYDLLADPGETTPAPCDPPCERLLERLRRFAARLDASAGPPAETAPVDPEDVELLKALGYL